MLLVDIFYINFIADRIFHTSHLLTSQVTIGTLLSPNSIHANDHWLQCVALAEISLARRHWTRGIVPATRQVAFDVGLLQAHEAERGLAAGTRHRLAALRVSDQNAAGRTGPQRRGLHLRVAWRQTPQRPYTKSHFAST